MPIISKNLKRAAIATAFGLAGATSTQAKINETISPVLVTTERVSDIASMAGLQEQETGKGAAFTFYKNSWDDYLKRRGDGSALDQKIDECRRDPASCTLAMRKWAALIDSTNILPNDKYLRATFVNSVADSLFHYDKRKGTVLSVASNYLLHSGKGWLQTPVESLTGEFGSGVCGDRATMIYETLLRTGFSPDELRVVGGKVPGGGYHTVVMANVNGKNLVLDKAPIVTDKNYTNGFRFEDIAGQTNFAGGMTPIVSFNDKGFHAYKGELQRSGVATLSPPDIPWVSPEINNKISERINQAMMPVDSMTVNEAQRPTTPSATAKPSLNPST